MSGQAAKLPGQVSQHVDLVDQAMGPIHQLARVPAQGPGAPAATDVAHEADADEAVPAGDLDDVWAARGAPGGAVVPTQVAGAGADQASQSNWAARML